jgi:hypothetical protein
MPQKARELLAPVYGWLTTLAGDEWLFEHFISGASKGGSLTEGFDTRDLICRTIACYRSQAIPTKC